MESAFTSNLTLLSSYYVKVSILDETGIQKCFKIVTAFKRLITKVKKMCTEIAIAECYL